MREFTEYQIALIALQHIINEAMMKNPSLGGALARKALVYPSEFAVCAKNNPRGAIQIKDVEEYEQAHEDGWNMLCQYPKLKTICSRFLEIDDDDKFIKSLTEAEVDLFNIVYYTQVFPRIHQVTEWCVHN